MTPDEQLAVDAFTRAADEFLRAQELVAEGGHPIRPGLLELLSSTSGAVGAALEQLARQPGFKGFRGWRYRDQTFLLLPRDGGFSLAVVPESQVCSINSL